MSLLRSLFLRASHSPWLARQAMRNPITRRAVRRFMPGETLPDALDAAVRLAASGLGALLTRLGENVTTPEEATEVRDHYVDVFAALRQRALAAEVSIKLTQLGMDCDRAGCEAHVRTLAQQAADAGSVLWIDMEDSRYTQATVDLYRKLLPAYPSLGIALQAYLRRTPEDIRILLPLKPTIRLVKGAYREPSGLAWPSKKEVDHQYLTVGTGLLDASRAGARIVFGTHDETLIARLGHHATARGLPAGAYEVHMLYGIRSETQRRLAAAGIPVKTLISYGSAWFPWYMRRLAERPANVWFLVKSIVS